MEKTEEKENKCLEDNSETEQEFNKIYKNVSTLLDQEFEIPLNIDKAKVKSKNFIFTDNAMKKLKK